jgi:hypothetical protein
VVHARDERAAAVVIVDQVKLPHRSRRIERRGGQARHQLLQLPAARTTGQRRVHDVPLDVEVRVGLPERTRRRLDGPLLEPLEDQETLGNHLPQACQRHAVSTADIFSRRLVAAMVDGMWTGQAGACVAHNFAFALK